MSALSLEKVKPLLCTLLAVALTGCATVDKRPKSAVLWHKTGSTIEMKQRDKDQCRVASLRSIPQVMVQDFYGGSFDPGHVDCDDLGGKTSCQIRGSYYSPPKIYNYDVNQRLRNQFVEHCFKGKGYKPVVKPYCDDEVAGYSNKEPAPPLSKIVCLDRKRTKSLE